MLTRKENQRQVIVSGRNAQIDLARRKIILYNSQYHNMFGFIHAVSMMDVYQMEYYIGAYSPLENQFRPSEFYDKKNQYNLPDLSGIKHVNLVLYGEKFLSICLIDTKCEFEVIDLMHLMLTVLRSFPTTSMTNHL